MSCEQVDALLEYRVTEAYRRLHDAHPEHELLIYFRLRDGTLRWNGNDGGLHTLGFHTQFSGVPGSFLEREFWLADAMEAPLSEKFERYIEALEDATFISEDTRY